MSYGMPIIEFENTTMVYPNQTVALKEFSLEIEKGEFVFVAGSSGSGKSTLIKLLLKEIEPTSGRVAINRKELSLLKKADMPKHRREIGVVFQDFKLLKDKTVYENVAMAKLIAGASAREIRKEVPRMLMMVGLQDRMKSYPHQLSGGEQQRTCLARALINRPGILLADEPTGNLDPTNSWEIMKLFEEINKNGTTLLVVTHNNEIVDKMRKRVVTLKDGVLVKDEKQGSYYHVI